MARKGRIPIRDTNRYEHQALRVIGRNFVAGAVFIRKTTVDGEKSDWFVSSMAPILRKILKGVKVKDMAQVLTDKGCTYTWSDYRQGNVDEFADLLLVTDDRSK